MFSDYIVCAGGQKVWVAEVKCSSVNGWLRFDNGHGLVAAFAPGFWTSFKSA